MKYKKIYEKMILESNYSDIIRRSNGDPIIFYHSSNSNFEKFDINLASKSAILGPGIYLTEDPNENWGRYKKSYFVKSKNPLSIREYPGEPAMKTFEKYFQRKLESVPFISIEKKFGTFSEGINKIGFDSILHYGPSNKPHILVFSNDQLLSTDKYINENINDNFILAYVQDNQLSDENLSIKFPDFLDQVDHLEKKSGINILRNKELNQVLIVDDKIVGALYTELDNDMEFSFDIIVHPKYRGKGMGDVLVKAGISEYNSLKSAYDNKIKLRVDVVNSQLINTFKKNGLRVLKDLGGNRKIMGI